MPRDMQVNEQAEQIFREMKELWNKWTDSGATAFQDLAIKYKAFLDAEGDRSILESVFPWNVLDALQLIAEEKLVPEAVRAILTNARLAKHLAMLDLKIQQQLANEGMEIVRHGRVQFVPLHHVTVHEFKRVISVDTGKVRVRSGAEQMQLFSSKSTKETIRWMLNVPPEICAEVRAIAKKENQTEEGWIIKLIRAEITKRKSSNGVAPSSKLIRTRVKREMRVN